MQHGAGIVWRDVRPVLGVARPLAGGCARGAATRAPRKKQASTRAKGRPRGAEQDTTTSVTHATAPDETAEAATQDAGDGGDEDTATPGAKAGEGDEDDEADRELRELYGF